MSKEDEEDSNFDPINQCGKCKEAFSDNDKRNYISCDVCQLWFHGKCAVLTNAEIKVLNKLKAVKWYCDTCLNVATKIINQIVSLNNEQAQMKTDIADLQASIQNLKDEVTQGVSESVTKTIEKMNNEAIKNVVTEELKNKTETMNNDEIKQFIKDEVKSISESAKSDNPSFPALGTPDYSKALKELATKEFPKYVRTELSEREQIEKLKMNLIISGIPEKTSEEVDTQEVKTLLEKELNINADISKTERLKKNNTHEPALLRVVFVTQLSRREVLKKAVDLRKSINKDVRERIFIRPDLTKQQLAEQKNLRDLLKEKRAANDGKMYKIIRNEVKEVKTTTQQ